MHDCSLWACKMGIAYCTQCEALVINGSHTVILPLVTDAPPTHTLWVQFILSPSLPSYLCVVFIVYNEYTTCVLQSTLVSSPDFWHPVR